MPKNPKRDPLGSLNTFTNRKLRITQGVPFDKIQKIAGKSRIVPKKTQRGDPLVSLLLLEALKNFWFSARLALFCFSKSEN